MTIFLMNAGRGAGKTHALIEWAKESPSRYVVGMPPTLSAMADAGLSAQSVHYNIAPNVFRGKGVIEVAFDDFDGYLRSHLPNHFGLGRLDSVILVTNLPVWENAPKTGFDILTGPYAEKIRAAYGSGMKLVEETLQRGADAVEKVTDTVDLGDVVDALLGVVSPPAAPAEPEEDPDEPDTKRVRMDELRLGDVLPGKGKVVSIKFETTSADRVVATVMSSGFEGKLIKMRGALVEIEDK